MNEQVEEKDPWTRDEDGKIVYPKTTKEDNDKIRIAQSTYIFHHWFKGYEDYPGTEGYHPVVMEFHETESDRFPAIKTRTLQLFKFPDHPFTQEQAEKAHAWIHKYEIWLNKYFAQVLAYYPDEERDGLRFQRARLIIDEATFQEINKLIEDYNLHEHSDFIFFLISSMQHMYLDKISHAEEPEEVKRVKNYPKQVQKLLTVLELTERERDHKWDYSKGMPPRLDKVIFKFKNIKQKTFVIEDPHLVYFIVEDIKKQHSTGSYKNWKKQLKVYPLIYSENEKDNAYRYRLSKALHNLFTEEKIFPLDKKKKSTDDEVRCIARMFEFAHIYAFDKKGNRLEVANDGDVIKIVRHWIERREPLKEKERIIQIIEKKDILYKYFDKALIDSIDTTHSVNELNDILYICDRFEIMQLLPEMIHLFKILNAFHRACTFQQISLEESPDLLPEYHKMIKFVKTFKEGDARPLSQLNISLKDNSEINVSSPFLLDFIGKALKDYYENNPADFRIDLVKKENEKPVLKEAHERFIPKFCLSCHNMFKGEIKLTSHDFNPSEKYFTIIGLMLQKSWMFSHHEHDEHYLRAKVKEWVATAKAVTK